MQRSPEAATQLLRPNSANSKSDLQLAEFGAPQAIPQAPARLEQAVGITRPGRWPPS